MARKVRISDDVTTYQIKKVKFTSSDNHESVKSLKSTKENNDMSNTIMGTMSDDIQFRGQRCKEQFFADTGANLNIVGLQVARDNKLRITKIKTPKQIIDASRNPLDIVGECSFYVKLDVFAGKLKKMDAMVLRGNDVDREVLISGQLLKK